MAEFLGLQTDLEALVCGLRLSDGVTVAQGPLEAFVMVRIHVGQPIFTQWEPIGCFLANLANYHRAFLVFTPSGHQTLLWLKWRTRAGALEFTCEIGPEEHSAGAWTWTAFTNLLQ